MIETTFAPGFTPPTLRHDATTDMTEFDCTAKAAKARPHKPHKMEFVIADDPYLRGKYALAFLALKPGECIKCDPTDVKKVREAMRDWIKRRKLPYKQVSMAKYPTDGLGRVWMLQK